MIVQRMPARKVENRPPCNKMRRMRETGTVAVIDRQENTARLAAADHRFAAVPAAACGRTRADVPSAAKQRLHSLSEDS